MIEASYFSPRISPPSPTHQEAKQSTNYQIIRQKIEKENRTQEKTDMEQFANEAGMFPREELGLERNLLHLNSYITLGDERKAYKAH